MKTQSENISKIALALSKAQSEFDPIIKSVKGYNYKYAPLDICHNATRKALSNNGLGVIQSLSYKEGGIQVLVTTLVHSSGEFFSSYTDFDIGQFKPIMQNEKDNKKSATILHTWGSTLTYLRRYTYCAIIGVIGEDEDTDGVTDTLTYRSKPEPIVIVNNKIDDEPRIKLATLIKENGCDPIEFTKFHGITSKDPSTVKNALSNFKELLNQFKDASIVKSEELQIANLQ